MILFLGPFLILICTVVGTGKACGHTKRLDHARGLGICDVVLGVDVEALEAPRVTEAKELGNNEPVLPCLEIG
jgi:hypothetical protein